MRFRRNTLVIVTLVDGQVFQGLTSWSWKWRTMRLVAAVAHLQQGEVPAAGIVYVPYRSVLIAQEVTDEQA